MKFRKQPVVVDAYLFRGGEQDGELAGDVLAGRLEYKEDGTALIATLEGTMSARPGDWIIRGVNGELYPCKPDIFAKTYVRAESAGLNFGQALELLKAGERVRRAGWNGKGMWLALTPGMVIEDAQHIIRGAARAYVAHEGVTSISIGAHIDMRAADGTLVIGWLASQTDMLASDWEVVS